MRFIFAALVFTGATSCSAGDGSSKSKDAKDAKDSEKVDDVADSAEKSSSSKQANGDSTSTETATDLESFVDSKSSVEGEEEATCEAGPDDASLPDVIVNIVVDDSSKHCQRQPKEDPTTYDFAVVSGSFRTVPASGSLTDLTFGCAALHLEAGATQDAAGGGSDWAFVETGATFFGGSGGSHTVFLKTGAIFNNLLDAQRSSDATGGTVPVTDDDGISLGFSTKRDGQPGGGSQLVICEPGAKLQGTSSGGRVRKVRTLQFNFK